MSSALWIAWATFHRARVVWIAGGIGAFGPAVIALVFFAAAGSGSRGLAGAKLESLAAERTWSSFIGASAQIASIGVLLAAGVVVAWWFGRDFENGMFATLFARALPRVAIAAARLVPLTACGAAMIVVGLAATLAAGATLGLDAADGIASATGSFLTVGVLTVALLPLVALAASASRSVTAAFGALLGIVVLAQLGVTFGLGAWMPWAVPELLAGIAGDAAAAIAWPHLALLVLLSGSCTAATLGWWARARVR
ncbi:MAG: type transport system permease protein [Solirubrobacteraceae bacterium]|jgi:ABC-2 type transport system permease protein|nr:type transport system permease protein [Solirubrobacteraceae bacterium]